MTTNRQKQKILDHFNHGAMTDTVAVEGQIVWTRRGIQKTLESLGANADMITQVLDRIAAGDRARAKVRSIALSMPKEDQNRQALIDIGWHPQYDDSFGLRLLVQWGADVTPDDVTLPPPVEI